MVHTITRLYYIAQSWNGQSTSSGEWATFTLFHSTPSWVWMGLLSTKEWHFSRKQEVNSVTDLPFIKHFRWSSQLYTETEWQYWETSRHKSHDALWCETSLLYDMRSMMSGHHECYTIKTTVWLFMVHNDKSISDMHKTYKVCFLLLHSLPHNLRKNIFKCVLILI